MPATPTRFTHAPPFAPAADPFNGLLLVDKPVGPTSHDIVARVRRAFRIDKVGHGGTLDPNATGLLILLIGRGTRLSDQVMSGDKTYTGIMRLGRATDSQDIDGNTLSEQPSDHITAQQVRDRMTALQGDIRQTPPMVSAVKIAGVPLYKLARKGQCLPREPRLIHVYRFQLTDWRPPLAHFEVVCSKGAYVRTLCHDIGQTLGCGACLEALRRTASGRFKVSDASPFEDLLGLTHEELALRIVPLATVVASEA